ncbi:MAG: hypothetical protein ACOCQD_04915, partial [archaeon]
MKLIRDNLGEMLSKGLINKRGKGIVYQVDIDRETTMKYLKKKLMEEAKEVADSKSEAHMLDEL